MFNLRIFLFLSGLLLFSNISYSQIPVSVPFNQGFVARQKTNLNSVDAYKVFTNADLNIKKAFFVQYVSTGNVFVAQGNDIIGFCRFEFNNGNVLEIPGIINWQEKSGSTTLLLGFIPTNSARINLKTYNGATNDYFIDGGTATTNTSSNIYTANFGLKYNNQTLTLTDGNNLSGSADKPDITTLNAYLSAVRLLDPSGPVTVNSLTTSDQTPTLTGTATLNSGEVLSVIVNGVSYYVSGGNLSLSGSTWTLNIPSTIAPGTYEVTAVITNSGGYILTDATSNELTIIEPSITANGVLKTFTTCSGCTVASQSFTVSGVNLSTNNLVVTAPTGVQVSTSTNTGFATSINIAPTAGTVTTTTVYAKLTNNATSAASGVISVTSTGANAKTITVTTNTDNALSFDGTNDYIGLPTTVAAAYNNAAVTIEAWIKTTDANAINEIISWGSTLASNNVVEFRTSYGKLQFVLNNGSGKFYGLESTNAVNTGKWVHVAVVKSGTDIVLYVNGQVASGAPVDNSDATSSPSLNTANIGVLRYRFTDGTYGTPDSYFSGGIDQLRVWNIAKTSADIAANMFVEMAGNETGLVASYDFNQGVAGGTNTTITILEGRTTTPHNGTLTNFTKTGSASNFVAGFIPSITATGNATILSTGNTLQLSNGLLGGVWASSNTSLATVNSATGLVLGVASGTVSISYTVCDKTVSYTITLVTPTITTNGTLKTFTSCSGCTITPQSFTVAGTNLGANITVTAPTGFVMSTTATGTYLTSLTYTPTSGTLATTSVFVKLINSATTGTTANITVASTGADSKTVTATVNTDNSMHFDGNDPIATNNDAINIGQPLSAGSSYTMEAWIKHEGNSAASNIISSYNNPFFISNNTLYAGVSGGTGRGGSWGIVSSLNTIELNKWIHVAVTFDDAANKITLYKNGIEAGTATTTSSYFLETSEPLYIGSHTQSDFNPTSFFKGNIDEVRIWNTVRSATDIQNYMFTELSGNESGLKAYYNFNQGIASATNTGITNLIDNSSSAYASASLSRFNKSGSTSNFVIGFVPDITAAGNATTVLAGGSLALSNGLVGGVWSTTNINIASIDASTGVITGVAAGTATMSYTICGKVVTYNVTVLMPTLTTGTLKTFTSCSGCSITPQSFTVSGANLNLNVIITASSGFEISNASAGTYSSTLSLTPISGTLASTNVFARLINSTTTASNGNFTVVSTGAVSKTVTATVNTDNALSFDGSNDIISTASNITPLNISGDITVEAWIRLNQMPTDYVRLIGKGSPDERTYGLWLYKDGSILWQQYTPSINNLQTNSSIIPVGKWCHIAVSRTGSNVKIYINGIEVAASILFSGTSNASTAPLEIGGSSSIHKLLNGSMDEVRIWNVGRTSNQIADNYLSELVGDGNSNETGLVAYYNFNQGTAGGSNSSILSIEDRTSNGFSGTLINFAKTGSTSNFVSGVIPEITASGNATSVVVGSTLALSNVLVGGVWSSTNINIASIDASTGVITGVAAGTATLSYTICEKVVSYNVTVLVPTLTTGTLKTFTSCSGCSITPQSFTVAGANLNSNVIVTAPAGLELSNASAGTYSSTLSLTQTSGTLTTTTVYARLINTATTTNGGNFIVASTGAVSKTVTATVNTDNALMFDNDGIPGAGAVGGGNDYVDLGDVLDVTTTTYTKEAWVYWKGATLDYSDFFTKEVVNAFAITKDNKLHTNFGDGSVWKGGFNSTNTIPLNKWTHVAITRSNAGLIKMYINGVLDATTYTNNFTGSNTVPHIIGGKKVGTTLWNLFNGAIDNARVWNTERSATEIADNLFTELNGNETGLLANYDFNQGTAGGANSSINILIDKGPSNLNGTISGLTLTGSTSNFVVGFIPEISGATSVQKTATINYTNTLTGGTWSSAATSIATVDAFGMVTGVAAGSATITYTICEKTVSKVVTVVAPTITSSGTLTLFNTCLGTASAAQTFTVSAQYLTANLVLNAPAGYELATSVGGTYSTTLNIAPASGTISATLIYVRLSSSSVNGQSGNITITSTDAVTRNIATGTASVTRSVVASVTISSNATNNTICAGTNIVFTATPTNGGNAPTYQWYNGSGAISGAISATYSTTLSNNSDISVEMVSSLTSCVTGSPANSNSITTTVTSIPATPSVISGASTICMNSNQVYSVAAVSGATSYTWVVTGNISATISSTTNVLNITASNAPGSGTLEVFANNACGTSIGSASYSITVNSTPAPTASFTVSGNTVCMSNAGVTFTSTSTPNATTSSTITTHAWTFGDGATASTTTPSNTYTASGTYDAILTITDAAACTSSISSRITVDPISVAGTATAAKTTICEGTSTVLTLSGNIGTIQWQSSTDGTNFNNITGATSATYTTANLTATAYYKAIVTSGVCSSATSGVVTVTVSPIPTITLGAVANVYSNATNFELIYTNAIGSPNEFSIATIPNALPGFTAINSYGLLVSPLTISIPTTASGTYNFNLTLANANLGCTSATIPFTLDVLPESPANLSYTTPNVYTVGTTITSLNPTSTGGPIASYSIAPSLPAGLTLNTGTGIISGTPTATSVQTSYTVTGTNTSGTVTATVVITVIEAAPLSLSYTTPNVYTVGTTITSLNPTSTGGPIASYSIAPSLPAGLTLNTSTGIISGTPTATSVQTSYTVTGTNTSGTVTATVVITVIEAAPLSLSYTTPNVYTVGTTITSLNPTSTGGPIASYSIAPSLPAGLTLNTSTGIISGTPTATSVQTSYTVTGTNTSGTVTATVVITVIEAAPLSLSYTTPNVYTVGTTITSLNPTSTGGPIASYSIAPSLPAGLTLNTGTGIISGTPTAASVQTSYTVTGTNASGTITATVVITVNEAAPLSLSYTTPNVYTVGTTITSLNPTSTGGPIASYSIAPSLPVGLTLNTSTGIISGTPTATSGLTSYTVTGTNASGTVTATVIITVVSGQPLLPQGGINAIDYKLLAPDSVKIKLNIQAGASPFNIIIGNNNNNFKDTISNVVDGDIIKLSPVNNSTVYSIVKLTDNNGISRTSGFSKDTTLVTILAPNIALTLKADKAIKLPDNSFDTKLLLKINNSGEIDLKNVQVNANLSEVFPAGINYTLDSVRVLTGNVTINNGYKGNGTAKSPNSVNKGISVSSGIKANAVLDANYLFSNGVNMAINEESDIVFYISIAPTSENVVLKLQFTSAGEGVLTKSDGSTSQQSSIAASDDGTNIALHPNNTNLGIPAPTYLPLFPIASIGAALSASGPTIVTDGYTFDFVAKLKNFSNINLDTIAIINDFSKTFTSPDTAYIINTPVVTGGITYNTNFNGYSNTLLIDSAVKLVVGDSATIAYTLFVKTTKTTGSWSSSILGSGHSTIDYVYVSDVSKDGINPDPNGDKDPLEQGSTSFYVNYTPPAPPVVENKTYIFGTTMPLTIAPLVKSYPTGSVPVWCNIATALCSTIAPASPTIIGKYVYQLRSYDTTTKLYSIDYVNDTVIIKPPVPLVNDSTYIIGLNTNPANVGVQVIGMQGSVLNYFLLANRQSVVPVLGTTVSVKRYTVSQTVNAIESDTAGFNVAMLNQNDMVHLQKIAEEPILQSNSTFNITYKFIVNNLYGLELTNVLITDNLQNTIPITAEYTIVSISATGGLVANSSFNGSTNTFLSNASSKVNAFAKDTLMFTLNIKPKGFTGVMNNTATIAATTRYGAISMVSSAATKIAEVSKSPTPVIIPDVIIDIPEVFSPNRDGVNDRFVIIKPFGTTLNLEIFNRWGNIVYANPDYNNEWDGRGTNNFIGQDLLDGGYYYNLKAINKNGETKIFKGFVIIQR